MTDQELPSPQLDRWTRFVESPWTARILSAGIALGSGTVLGIARWLDPSPAGHGTHLQIGLGQCTILMMFGIPCPMCGMTTTFSLFAHLRPIDAVANQPFGLVMFLLTVGAFAISVAEVIAPRRRWQRISAWSRPYDPWLAAGFLSLMGMGWVYKMWLMGALM